MTTLNLSVGLNTSAAKESLTELKKHLAGWTGQLAVSIDEASLDKQVASAIRRKKYKFEIDASSTRGIRDTLENDLNAAFAKIFKGDGLSASARQLRWDHQQFRNSVSAAVSLSFDRKDRKLWFDSSLLSQQVHTAITEGFSKYHSVKVDIEGLKAQLRSAGQVEVGVKAAALPPVKPLSGGPATPLAADAALSRQLIDSVVNSIKAALTPAVDELAKAAATLTGGAKRVGQGVGATKDAQPPTLGPKSASRSVSSTDAQGFRVTYREKLEDPDAALRSGLSAQADRDLLRKAKLGDGRGLDSRNKATMILDDAIQGSLVRMNKRRKEQEAALKRDLLESYRSGKFELSGQIDSDTGKSLYTGRGQKVLSASRLISSYAEDQKALPQLKKLLGTALFDEASLVSSGKKAAEAYRAGLPSPKKLRDDNSKALRESILDAYRSEKFNLAGQINPETGKSLYTSRGQQVLSASKLVSAYSGDEKALEKVKKALGTGLFDEASLVAAGKKAADAYRTGTTSVNQIQAQEQKAIERQFTLRQRFSRNQAADFRKTVLDAYRSEKFNLAGQINPETGKSLYTSRGQQVLSASKLVSAYSGDEKALEKVKKALGTGLFDEASLVAAGKRVAESYKTGALSVKQAQAQELKNNERIYKMRLGFAKAQEQSLQRSILDAYRSGKFSLAGQVNPETGKSLYTSRGQQVLSASKVISNYSGDEKALEKVKKALGTGLFDEASLVAAGKKTADSYRAVTTTLKQALAEEQKSANETYRASQRFAKAQLSEFRRGLLDAYKSEKFNLAGQINPETGKSLYTSRGQQVLAASQIISSRSGDAKALQVLKKELGTGLFEEASLVSSGQRSAEAYRAMGSAAKRSAEEIKEKNASVRASSKAMYEAHSAARGLAGGLGALWVTWGSTVPIIAGAAIAASLRQIYEEGKKAEYQLAFLKGLSGVKLDIGEVERATAGSLFSTGDALEGLRALTQSGYTAREALSALPDVLNLAAVGETSVGDAAFAATGVLKAFSLELSDVGRVSDVIAKSSAMSNASVKDMMEAFKYASVAGALYGETLEETGASLALLSEKNIKGTMAGTAHMNMMREIMTPTKQASKAFKALGIDLDDMSRRGLSTIERLDEIREKTALLDSTSLKSFATAVGGERGNRELAPILEAGTAKLADFKARLEESSGFTRKVVAELQDTVEASSIRVRQSLSFAFSKAFEDSKGQLQSFNNTLANAFSSEGFQSFVSQMAVGLGNLTSFIVENGRAIGALVGIYGGLKVLSMVAGSANALAMAISELTLSYRAKAAAAGSATVAVTTNAAANGAAAAAATSAAMVTGRFATAIGLVASAFGTVGAVVGIAITAYQLFASRQDTARESSDRFNNGIQTTIRLLDQEIERLRQAKIAREKGIGGTEAAIQDKQGALGKYLSDLDEAYSRIQSGKGGAIRVSVPDGEDITDLQGLIKAYNESGRKRAEYADIAKKSKLVSESQKREDSAAAGKTVADWIERAIDTLDDRISKTKSAADKLEMQNARAALKARLDAGLGDVANSRQAEQYIKRLSPYMDAGGVKANFMTPDAVDKRTRDDELREAKRIWEQTKRDIEREKEAEAQSALREKESNYRNQLQELDAFYQAQDSIIKAREAARVITLEEADNAIERNSIKRMEKRLDLANEELQRRKEFVDRNPDLDSGKKWDAYTKMEEARSEVRRLQDEISVALETSSLRVRGAINKIVESGQDARVEAVLRDLKAIRELNSEVQSATFGTFLTPGPSATQALFPRTYVTEMGTRGLPAESAALINAQRDAERRQNYQSRMEKKFVSESKPRGRVAVDQSLAEAMKVYDEYQPRIEEFSKQVDQAQRTIDRLMAQRDSLANRIAGESLSDAVREAISSSVLDIDKDIASVTERLNAAQLTLAAMEKNRNLSAETRGTLAAELYEKQRSMEYGFNQFWKEYTSEATDSARVVRNVMGQSFGAIEDGLTRLITTGKGGFKDLASSVLADAARMMASQGVRSLLSLALNFAASFFMPGAGSAPLSSSGVRLGDSIGSAGSGLGNSFGQANFGMSGQTYSLPPIGFADGGVMTAMGRMPLDRFASGGTSGGITNRPRLSLSGEWTKAEAFVPLEDGRTIPVSLRDLPAMGGDNVNVHVTVMTDGNTKVQSDAAGNQAAKLAREIEGAVMGVIKREKRSGGLLEKAA